MKLTHLHSECCEHCKAPVVAESWNGQHTNGQFFESQTYKCGGSIRWSPNFNRMEVVYHCPKHPTSIKEREKNKKDFDYLMKYVDAMDITSEKYNELKYHLKSIFKQ